MSNRQERKKRKHMRVMQNIIHTYDPAWKGLPTLTRWEMGSDGEFSEVIIPMEEWVADSIAHLPKQLRDKLIGEQTNE